MTPRLLPLVVLLAGCPATVSLECLACAGDADCAPEGLACRAGRCEGPTVCPSTLPALDPVPDAAVLLRDAFEQDALLIADGGRWDALVGPAAGQRLELSTLSRAAQAMLLTDTAPDNGDGGLRLVRTVNRAAGDLYLRAWLWVDRQSDAGTLGALTVYPDLGAPLVELQVGDQVRLRCGDRAGGSQLCDGGLDWVGGTWHQLALAMEGVGTDAGTCTLWVDGQTVCRLGRDWAGARLQTLAAGAVSMEPRWMGELRLDNVALTHGSPAPDRLALVRPATGLRAGACVPVRVEFRESLGGGLARLVRQSRIALDAGPAVFHEPPGCDGPPITQILIDAGVAFHEFALQTPDGGTTPASALDRAADLEPVTASWTFLP